MGWFIKCKLVFAAAYLSVLCQDTLKHVQTTLMKMKILALFTYPVVFSHVLVQVFRSHMIALCEEQPEIIQVIFPSSELLTREPLQLDLWFSKLNSRIGSSEQIILLIQFQWSDWTEWMSHKSGWMIHLLIELIRSLNQWYSHSSSRVNSSLEEITT